MTPRPARRQRLIAAAAGLVLAPASALVMWSGPAAADTAPPAGTPATVSGDGLPTWQVNGVVWSEVVVGNTVYATGSFTRARPPGVAAGGAGEVTANNIFAFDITTGNRVASFNHSLSAQGRKIARSPDGTRVYVGGDFTSVDGVAHNHLAAFNTSDNTLVAAFAPNVASQVAAVTASNDTVWVGGSFGSVNGQSRLRLAAVRATNGTNLPWAPTADDNNVTALVLAPGGTRVIVGGKFSTINHAAANGMGSVDAVTGANLPWAANQRIQLAGSGSGITSLATDGVSIFGSGFAFGSGNFEGSFSANPTTGVLNWANDCHGDTYDIAPVGSVLYTVSHAHDCRWIGSFPESADRNVNMRHALAFTTYATGFNSGPDSYGWNYAGVPDSTLLQWFPELSLGTFTGQSQAAWSVAGNADYVVLGGEFPRVNGVNQQGLVRFAVRAKATNKRGPVRPPSPTAPTAQALGNRMVRVTWQSAYDMDNARLTYQVFRSGVATPVFTTSANSSYWSYPALSFTDTNLTIGSSLTYRVQVSDPLGNTISLPTTAAVVVR